MQNHNDPSPCGGDRTGHPEHLDPGDAVFQAFSELSKSVEEWRNTHREVMGFSLGRARAYERVTHRLVRALNEVAIYSTEQKIIELTVKAFADAKAILEEHCP